MSKQFNYDALLKKLKETYPDKYPDLERTYLFAKKAHEGQKRASGEDYITHPCAVAEILADFGIDAVTVQAAFLHDVLEDTTVTSLEIQAEFGDVVFELVEGVTKLDHLDLATNKEEAQAENLRKLFMAMAKDLRVIIIKFADRLHNMRSLDFMPQDKQQRISRETMDIYAPLAGRLGISFFKCELEDLSMKYLYPMEYKELSEAVSRRVSERKDFLNTICKQIEDKLKELNIHGEVNGRLKHLWSVYKKLKHLDIGIDQIYDLQAVRIIVDDVKECYTLLGEVHTMWKPIPGRVKDYISVPKANNYQSIHTTVITPFGEIFEIQIRTYEMHKIDEYGVAAHWKYKEGNVDPASEQKIQWLREVMDSQSDVKGASDFMESVKVNVFEDEIFIYTPKGALLDLPIGSTPVDVAYKIHTEVGNHCVGAKVNKKMVPLYTKLQTGDVVEILTNNSSSGPSLDWLKFVTTAQARSKIRSFFKKENKEENIKRGREMLEIEAKRKGYKLPELLQQTEELEAICKRLTIGSLEDMYAQVGFGGVTTAQILNKLIESFKKKHVIQTIEEIENIAEKEHSSIARTLKRRSKNGVLVSGNTDFFVRMARCCSPIPGDDIIGFVSRSRGVVIHKKDCPNILELEKERFVDVEWDIASSDNYEAILKLKTENKSGLLANITTVISNMDISIVGVTATTNKDQLADIIITVTIHSLDEIETLMNKLKGLKGVVSVTR